ncbi:MAG: response regulator [Fulvivirga sp.]|uniref:response regulator n=1 Tax=Fulvivirga sp. TaxID=1931237 RepID=UPI0032EA9DEA
MKKILIVDDTRHILEELKDILEMENFEVITAINGKTGLDSIESGNPDLIITDIHMPGISGLELLKKVKSTDATKHIPVIVLTANADSENMKKAIQSNADKYLKKPCASGVLIEAINRLLP